MLGAVNPAAADGVTIPVRVVVVTTFETGSLPGYPQSLASAYLVASPVVRQLAAGATPDQ